MVGLPVKARPLIRAGASLEVNLGMDAREERGVQQVGWEERDERSIVDGPAHAANWGGATLADRSKSGNPEPEMEQRNEWVGDPLLALSGGSELESLCFTRRTHAARSDPSVAGSHRFGEGDSFSDPKSGEARRAGTQPLDRRIQVGARRRRGSLGHKCHRAGRTNSSRRPPDLRSGYG